MYDPGSYIVASWAAPVASRTVRQLAVGVDPVESIDCHTCHFFIWLSYGGETEGFFEDPTNATVMDCRAMVTMDKGF